jgi:hypothetical protein
VSHQAQEDVMTVLPENIAKKMREGQGYNDARGEIDDKKETAAKNGLNVNNDPVQQRRKEKEEQRNALRARKP